MLGTNGNDDLRSGTGNELLCGFGGNDTLWGCTGEDILIGGPGADSLYGESGGDTLYTDAQDRVVNGGSGRNQIIQVLPTPTATPMTPTEAPVTPTAVPTEVPTEIPTQIPTQIPTVIPTAIPEDPLVTRCKQDATAAGFDANTFTKILVGTEGDDNYNFTYITTSTLVCSFGGADFVKNISGSAVFLAGDGDDYLEELDGGTFNGGAGTNTIEYPMGCAYTQVEDPYARSSGSRVVQPATVTPTEEPVMPTASPITPTGEPILPTAEPVMPTVEPVPPTVPASPAG